MDSLDAIKQTFFGECEERLNDLEAALMLLGEGRHDPDAVNAAFRAVHTVKGGAGAFNLGPLVGFAHAFETVLDALRAGACEVRPALVATLLRAADLLSDLVRAAQAGVPHDEARTMALAAELAGCVEVAAAAPPPLPRADAPRRRFGIAFRPQPEMYAKGNDTTVLLREVALLGRLDVTCATEELPSLDAMDPEGAYFAWTAVLDTEQDEAALREIFDFVEWDSTLEIVALPEEEGAESREAPPGPKGADGGSADDAPEIAPPSADAAAEQRAGSPGSATIRVDLERIDRLIDLVGELAIHQAMLADRIAKAGLGRRTDVGQGLDELEQLTRQVQDGVMTMRAQPVRSVFGRMPRLVREVSAQVGKSVRLVTEGEATEVDRAVIEGLSDPLTHMIRNAIDHGLETPERRRAAGKPEDGTLRLSAAHRSGRIVIEIEDDGQGIDRDRVRRVAADKGLVDPDVILGDDETDNLIFLPGFSTAATVSDLSGRGVGMDVVKRSIAALGGRIAITSRPGRGTTFTLSLPLTLAVLDGMVVTAAGQTLVVPLTAVIEVVQPKTATTHGFGGGARVLGIRGGFVPLVDVAATLGFRPAGQDGGAGVALLVEVEGGVRSALLVDEIQGQRQLVIKSLETNYGHVEGVAAATILGDGRVALILDVDAVVASGGSSTGFSLSRAG